MLKDSSQELQEYDYIITMQGSSDSVNFILWKLWLKTKTGFKVQHRNI